jgi:hypothetical protein
MLNEQNFDFAVNPQAALPDRKSGLSFLFPL